MRASISVNLRESSGLMGKCKPEQGFANFDVDWSDTGVLGALSNRLSMSVGASGAIMSTACSPFRVGIGSPGAMLLGTPSIKARSSSFIVLIATFSASSALNFSVCAIIWVVNAAIWSSTVSAFPSLDMFEKNSN